MMRVLIVSLVANVIIFTSAGVGGTAGATERPGRVPAPPSRADIVVPSASFSTIQSAIDAVTEGGSIRVLPG